MRKSVLRLHLLLGAAIVAPGCAHAPPDNAGLAELRAKLTDAQRKEADGRRRIDELENRVFLMTDRMESQKVAASSARAPRLPVVTLRPTEDNESRREASDESRSEEEPEFLGAARSVDAHHVRPVLRGDGELSSSTLSEPRPVARAPRTRTSAPETNVRLVGREGGDSLGVAPVPPIPKAAPAERGKAPITAPAPAAQERGPLEDEPIRAYRAAYAELTAGRFDEAERQLRAFVKHFPRHDYADNAQYWLGECFYARHRYREAAVEFRAAVARYPVGNKAPDALLKLAYSLLSLGDSAEARRLLEELPATYPRTEAARLAAQKLAELGAGPAAPVSSEDPR